MFKTIAYQIKAKLNEKFFVKKKALAAPVLRFQHRFRLSKCLQSLEVAFLSAFDAPSNVSWSWSGQRQGQRVTGVRAVVFFC